jgi:hypothetical protein
MLHRTRHCLFLGRAPPRSRPTSARLVAGRYLPPSTGRTGPAPLGNAEMPVRPWPDVRIPADPSVSVHAIGLVHTRHEEDQPNARVFNKISETINKIVAATVGNEQCPTVIRNLHEPRPIALRRTVETVPRFVLPIHCFDGRSRQPSHGNCGTRWRAHGKRCSMSLPTLPKLIDTLQRRTQSGGRWLEPHHAHRRFAGCYRRALIPASSCRETSCIDSRTSPGIMGPERGGLQE